MNSELHAEQVAEYLNENRDFFHVFPELINELKVPHPKQDREISLLERQVWVFREERDKLNSEITSLKDIAGENGELLRKVYDFSHGLLAAKTEQEAMDWVYKAMYSEFKVEAVACWSWELPTQPLEGFQQLGLSQSWAKALKQTLYLNEPVCGVVAEQWQQGLFEPGQKIESVCVLPLGNKRIWGVLALGSEEQRFTSDLGTYFLQEIGRMISHRFARLF